jgi:hypothetical protein
MTVDGLILEVARETVRTWPDLALGTRTARPKAWGALAAKGVAALRARLGRPLTESERRLLWAALWQATRQEPGT